MYIDRVFLPAFSNREDFLITVGIFDDDTNDPIDLSGITGSGTFASWVVTINALAGLAGTVTTITASTTSLTIGSGQKSLTVPIGLNIQPTQPVTIANGSNSMFGSVTSYNAVTGALLVEVGMNFQFQIRVCEPNHDGSGYIPWYDWGTPDDQAPILNASTGDGISIIDTGVIQIEILENTFRTLSCQTYLASLTMFNGRETRQVFVGKLPVIFGGVST